MSGYTVYDALGLLEGWAVGAVGSLTVLLVPWLSERVTGWWRAWQKEHRADSIDTGQRDSDTGPVGFVPDVPENLDDWLATAPAMRLEDLDLTVRSYNALNCYGIHTIDRLIQFTPDMLLGIRNFGRSSLGDVQEKLAAAGWTLANDSESVEVAR